MKRFKWDNKNNRKPLLMIGLVFVVCLVMIVVVQVNRKYSMSKATTGNKLQTTVDVLAVPRTGLVRRISLTGQTVPEAQVDIAAKYQGKVTAVYGALGQQVAAGQVLVVQDTGDAEISIAQNQAAYRQANAESVVSASSFLANYDKAKADYSRVATTFQRYQSLYQAGAISREELDTSEQAMADAKAALDALANQMSDTTAATIDASRAAAIKAQQGIRAIEKQRDDLVLCAPRSGMIGFRQVEVGSMVQPGQKLLSIVDNSRIYVDCQVSEQDLAALAVGMTVDVQIESLGRTFPGTIIYMSPSNDAQSLTFSLRIALTDPDPAVKSGMFARTVIQAIVRPATLVVPKDGVLEKNGYYYVFVINEQNATEQRTVQVGARGDQNVEILSGLNEGERIAVSNLARLRPGMTVIPNSVTPQ